ncbi:glycoside hydrolase family 3 C-terminal domain-containing protein, partial [Actinacidiphila alni]|uniref:glycoside hydrolase family 3 C-terminal domain-containing protein n=1 Tax=Actinacidiphila alni TaxID=380248 RepID=UPI0033DC11DF
CNAWLSTPKAFLRRVHEVAAGRPAPADGDALAREVARRGFVLVRNELRGGAPVLPLAPNPRDGGIALIGAAARDPRILGGGSAQVFPDHVVPPLDGLRAALHAGVALTHSVGADPTEELPVAGAGFALTAVARDEQGRELGTEELPNGQLQWLGELPEGVAYDALHTVETRGWFTPRVSGAHRFGTRGTGGFTLTVAGQVLFDGLELTEHEDPFEAFLGTPAERGTVELTAGERVEVSLVHAVPKGVELPIVAVGFALLHGEPARDPEELLAEAVEAARAAHTAIVVVATTERVESEGFDRRDLRLPGRQDELVARVAAVNPRTVVVVNSGSPVELPWRDEVAAVLLAWFPGQEAGAALADVLLGAEEPGGRLPTTWPVRLADAPVSRVTPADGVLPYEEGVFIGYRAWDRQAVAPAYPFGHGLGYTEWEYEALVVSAGEGESSLATVEVRVRNAGARAGREVVQLYLAPEDGSTGAVERPARWLAGFAAVAADAGEAVTVTVEVPRRAAEVWDEASSAWRLVPGTYSLAVGRSLTDSRLTAAVPVP